MTVRRILVCSLLAIGLVISLWLYRAPWKEKQSCVSPDGNWSITLFGARDVLSVQVRIAVESRDRGEVFSDIIDARDDWLDFDSRYHDLECSDTGARLGPGWWDGQNIGYYSLTWTDMMSSNEDY